MPSKPPKWILRYLERTCSQRFLDELQGDLVELYHRDIQQLGPRKAKKRLIWKALMSPRWYRLPGFPKFQPIAMWKNHFKVAIRHALRHTSPSVVHLLGLIMGIAAVAYIALFITNELAFDSMHKRGDELYRVLRYDPTTGNRSHGTASLHGETLVREFPFLEMCRFGNDPVKIGENDPLLIDEFFWADSTFFEFFSFEMLAGDPRNCLHEVNSLVITRSLSEQLFGTVQSVGRTLPLMVYDGNQEFDMQVTGVVEDPPQHSHIQFRALGSMANAEILYERLVGLWGFSWVRTYIHVPDGRISEVAAGLPAVISRHLGNDVSPTFGMSFQPFNKVYLYSQDIARNTFRGDVRNLYIFGSIGVLILLVSLFNYINLATARAVTRIKEIGIRRVLGSRTMGIFSQFISESLLFTLVAAIVGVVLLWLLLPNLNSLLDLDLTTGVVSPSQWVLFGLSVFAVGILSGIPPALSVTGKELLVQRSHQVRFRPAGKFWTRKSLIGIQFAVTIGLLASTLIVFRQYEYLRDFDLGFDTDQLLHISIEDRNVQERLDVLKDQIRALSGVSGAAMTGEKLPSELNNTWGLDWQGSNLEEPEGVDIVGVDMDYFELMDIEFVAGNNFTRDYPVDSARSVILNEATVRLMGMDDIVGQQISVGGRTRTVIGVVKDHHNTTLHTGTVPLAYFIYPPGFRVSPDNLLVRLGTDNLQGMLANLEKIWKEFSTDPFEYTFVDDSFAAAYGRERRFSALMGAFTMIAVLISLIGLFGLVSFTTEIRLREISVRRVLGASRLDLIQLLGRDFLMLFAVGLVIAIPIVVYFMKKWLANYAYHTGISTWLILIAAAACLTLSFLIVWYHLQRTTLRSPSEVLARE